MKLKSLKPISEKEFQSQVVQLAKLRGWKVYHTFDSRRSTPGFLDLVLVRERVLFVECKTDTGQLTDEQFEWLRALDKAGQKTLIWRPMYWPCIENELE